MVTHCAKFSAPILSELQKAIDPTWRILDPFAGTGLIHSLTDNAVGIELEYEWASMHPRTMVGDSRHLPFADNTFDAIVTSPAYGNRMADSFNATDSSKRNTYKHSLGRDLTSGNSGAMQWGDAYRELHRQVWKECIRVCNGVVLLNISDHIRKGQRQPVSAWHVNAFLDLGCKLTDVVAIPTKRLKFGQNYEARVPVEYIFTFEV